MCEHGSKSEYILFVFLYMLAVHLFSTRFSFSHLKKSLAFQTYKALYICDMYAIFNMTVLYCEVIIVIVHEYGRKT